MYLNKTSEFVIYKFKVEEQFCKSLPFALQKLTFYPAKGMLLECKRHAFVSLWISGG